MHSREKVQQAIELYASCGDSRRVARKLAIPRRTISRWVEKAAKEGTLQAIIAKARERFPAPEGGGESEVCVELGEVDSGGVGEAEAAAEDEPVAAVGIGPVSPGDGRARSALGVDVERAADRVAETASGLFRALDIVTEIAADENEDAGQRTRAADVMGRLVATVDRITQRDELQARVGRLRLSEQEVAAVEGYVLRLRDRALQSNADVLGELFAFVDTVLGDEATSHEGWRRVLLRLPEPVLVRELTEPGGEALRAKLVAALTREQEAREAARRREEEARVHAAAQAERERALSWVQTVEGDLLSGGGGE